MFFFLVVVTASLEEVVVVVWYFLLEVDFNSGLAGRAGLVVLVTRDLLFLAGDAVRDDLGAECKSLFFFKAG